MPIVRTISLPTGMIIYFGYGQSVAGSGAARAPDVPKERELVEEWETVRAGSVDTLQQANPARPVPCPR